MGNETFARSSENELVLVRVRILGTGASAPTKVLGKGITVSYVGVGQYRFTFAKNPYTFAGVTTPGRQATTPGDIKGVDLVFGAYVAPTASALGYIDLYMYDAGAAHDLAALEWLAWDFAFKRTKSTN